MSINKQEQQAKGSNNKKNKTQKIRRIIIETDGNFIKVSKHETSTIEFVTILKHLLDIVINNK